MIIKGLGDEFNFIDCDLITRDSQSRILYRHKGYRGKYQLGNTVEIYFNETG